MRCFTAFLVLGFVTGCGCGETDDASGTSSGGSAGAGAMGGTGGGSGAVGGTGGEAGSTGGAAGADAGVDDTPPTITLAASSTFVTADGDVTFTATATDDVGVVEVRFEETGLLGTDPSAPYEQTVTLTAAENGKHTYKAIASDAAGNEAEATVEVVVAIDATNPVWQKQLNGDGSSTIASSTARSLRVDSSGRPLMSFSWGQGREVAIRYLTSGATYEELTSSGTSNPNIYYHGVAAGSGGTVAVVGASDGCGCSSIVDALVLQGPADPAGSLSSILGPVQSPASDVALAATLAANDDAYVVGFTNGTLDNQGSGAWTNLANSGDGMLFKLNSSGTAQWIRQWGSNQVDQAISTTLDSTGRVWVVGYSAAGGAIAGQSSAGGVDTWLKVFDSTGANLFTTQFGTTGDDTPSGIAALAGGGVVVAGHGPALDGATPTAGDTLAGNDGWLRFYDASFALVKTVQLGTAAVDTTGGVAVGPNDDVWVTGSTTGAITGTSNGAKDAFVRRYAANGDVVFTRQFGTGADETSVGVGVDAAGNSFVTGTTFGSLFATLQGASDVYLLGLGPYGAQR